MNQYKSNTAKNTNLYAQSLDYLGLAYTEIGEFDKADEVFKQALKIKTSIYGNNIKEYVNTLFNLVTVLYQKGSYSEAIEELLEIISEVEKTMGKDNIIYYKLIDALALNYTKMGLYSKAEPLHEEAVQNLKNSNDINYCMAIVNLGL